MQRYFVTAVNPQTLDAIIATVQQNSHGIEGCSDHTEKSMDFSALDITPVGVKALEGLGAIVKPEVLPAPGPNYSDM
jgi:hypothetical protein